AARHTPLRDVLRRLLDLEVAGRVDLTRRGLAGRADRAGRAGFAGQGVGTGVAPAGALRPVADALARAGDLRARAVVDDHRAVVLLRARDRGDQVERGLAGDAHVLGQPAREEHAAVGLRAVRRGDDRILLGVVRRAGERERVGPAAGGAA